MEYSPISHDGAPESPESPEDLSSAGKIARLASACRVILECLEDDADREGLQKTPQRMAKALVALTSGYSGDARALCNDALFECDSTELVIVKDIDVFSMCEHHMLPFHGKVHIAYLPRGKVLGLSKFARLVGLFSRRLQIQERLTSQIGEAVQELVDPAGVAVMVDCAHMCMAMRGVEKPSAKTVTTWYSGRFRDEAAMRAEFIAHVRC